MSVAVAVVGAVTVGGEPAAAAVSVSSVSLSTSTVILDGDAGCGNRAKVTVRVYDPRPSEDEIWGVSARVVAPNGDDADFLIMSYASRSGNYAYYTDWIHLCGFDRPGAYRIHTSVSWWDAGLTDGRTAERFTPFWVKRPTTLVYNAAPEPVKKGKALTHSGVLRFDPYGYGPRYGVKGITLRFYFKPTAARTYAYCGSTVTGTGGKFTKRIAATASGTWKVVYAGDGAHQSQTRYDDVAVKR